MQILSLIADTLTGKPVYKLSIPVKWEPKRPWWKFWQPRRPAQIGSVREFDIYPCVVGNQYRIAGRASLLPETLFNEDSRMLALTTEHLPHMLYIIAAAIQNNHLEPSEKLQEWLKWNLDNEEILEATLAALKNTNMEAFMNSIVLMKGTTRILQPETSPNDGSELIASHTETLDQPQNTSDGQNGISNGN